MTDQEIDRLRESLAGVWESPVMILEFYAAGGHPTGNGKVIATGNGHAIDFSYTLMPGEDRVILSLTTPMTGAMQYEIAEWTPDRLKMVKKGYDTAIDFVKK